MKHVLSLLLFVSFALLSKAELDPILEMVKLDDVPALRSRLEENPSSLEATGPFGQTPLLRAVLLGSKGAVQALLELGADAMATETTGGYNVLHAAGFQGRAEVLEILIDHFASAEPGKKLNLVSDQHEDGFYPIHVRCVPFPFKYLLFCLLFHLTRFFFLCIF